LANNETLKNASGLKNYKVGYFAVLGHMSAKLPLSAGQGLYGYFNWLLAGAMPGPLVI
jgi:hypothetical protein